MIITLKKIDAKTGFIIDDEFVDSVIKKNVEIPKEEFDAKKLYGNVVSTFLEKYVDENDFKESNILSKIKCMKNLK